MSLNSSTGKSSLLTATGNSFGKGSTLGKDVTDNKLLKIPEAAVTEKPNDDCASDKDSDSDYACEAPPSAEEPSTACSEPFAIKCVTANESSSTATANPKSSPLSKNSPDIPFTPGNRSAALTWLKSKENLKKIIHIYGLPPNKKQRKNIFKICGQYNDALILFSENEAYVEMTSEKAATAVVRNSKRFPIVISNHTLVLHYAREILNHLLGLDAPAPVRVKAAILKLPSGVHMKCGKPCVVWVFGHSIIAQAAERFQNQKWQQVASNGKIIYYWMGFDSLRLYQLREKVSEQKQSGKFPFPDVFILHLGGEDLIHSEEQKIKEDLAMEYAWLSTFFPDSLIVWSEIIPRPFWALGIAAEKINHTALKINKELSNLPLSKQFKCILHHNKKATWSPLDFYPKGDRLSDSGIDKFIENVTMFMDSMFLWC
ncbi:uncharacterized protein [Pleurodeles waltl]|uniref:uncharacterized protein n=1 Tax=Pleurodeles waltl TaxID=8319 RepID=UPI0037095670